MSDPLNVISNPPTTVIKIHGTGRDDVNGKLGIAIQYNVDRGRYIVQLCQNQTTMALKPENITKANTMESYQGQYQLLMNNPQIKSEITKYYNMIQSKLPPNIKPEYVVGGGMVVLLVFIYLFGFTRFITLLTMIILLFLIIGRDVMDGKSIEQISRNFPNNCRDTIERSFPIVRGRITNPMATGIVVIMLLLSGKTLVSSFGRPTRPMPPRQYSSSSSPYSGAASSRLAIEEAYKKGFEDARDGNDFGHSLPAVEASVEKDIPSYAEDEIPYDYTANPSSSSGGGRKFGMGQAMSLFYMYRMAMQLGTDGMGGSFSLERAMINIRTLPTWQMGIFAFSLYNLLKPFLF